MDLIPWFPAVTTTGLLAAALWLGRNLITTRLKESVQHEFNSKLEGVKAEQRASEERLKADLKLKEAEITALRSGALSAMASRHMALDKRRLEAVDQLWSAVAALAPAKGITILMKTIDFEKAAPITKREANARQAFELMGQGFDPSKMDLSGATKAHPFVTPVVWALYSALLAVVMHSVMRWMALKGGIGKDLSDNEAVAQLIKTALPHYSDYVDKLGPSAYGYVADALETQLLSEIQSMLNGVEVNRATLDQAADILKQSNAILSKDTASDISVAPQ